jgi:Mrp family chromosome partitioning ATPase
MDIIKDAVQRIERKQSLQSTESGGPYSHATSSVNDIVKHQQPTEFPSKKVQEAAELSNLRLYHSAMRNEKVHAAFTNLRTHIIQRTGKRSCSIVVSAVTQGGGASFVAMNLAAAFAADSSGSAVLVDCNFAGRRYEQFGDNESRPGVTDYVDGSAVTFEHLMPDIGIPGLRLLTGGRMRNSQREYFTRPRAKQMFSELCNQHDNRAVIVDAPPTLLSANANVLAAYCDAVLLVVPYGKATEQDIRAAVRSLPPGKLLGSVFNDVPHWRVAG